MALPLAGARMPSDPPAVLFDADARALAARHGSDSHFRWLATSDDPEAVALRAALERCFRLAGTRGAALRDALQHERWGQHAGALAHLLTLGLLAAHGLDVASDPALGNQSPDILAVHDGASLLVEVRAVTGAGTFPWEERRATGRQLSPAAREALGQSVAGILQKKAETYRPLVERLALPYVIALYEDKDSLISGIARDLLYGRGDGRDDSRAPDGGAFADAASGLAHVSAVLVFGRLDTPGGELLLRGELLENPRAASPLPPGARLARLRRFALDGTMPPRMRWIGVAPGAFGLEAS